MLSAARRMVIVGYDQAKVLDIACVTDTLNMAGLHGASPGYDICLATPGGRPIRCDSGLVLAGQSALTTLRGPLDTVLVSGGLGHADAAHNTRLVAQVRRLAADSRRVASVCTGASVLAAAGLLDGRPATTHWKFADDIAARYPAVKIDPRPLYIRAGNIWTSAGITAALDLTLALVEDDHGADLARSVARALVTYLQRPGNQAQVSELVSGPPPQNETVRRVVRHIGGHLDADLSIGTLAAMVGVTERHLSRLFVDHLGTPPRAYVRAERAGAARHLMDSTSLDLPHIAQRCGFSSTETLREAFRARFGTTPLRHRAANRSQHSAPQVP